MKKVLTTSILSFLLVVTAFTFLASPVHAALSYNVSVGYADDLRPTPFFPSPWCGGTDVALFSSVGDSVCAGSGSAWDSGAIMITNTGGSSISIQALTVTTPNEAGGQCDSGCSLWGASFPFSLAPGKHAIFAQNSGENFDTSDFGLPGIGPLLSDNCNAGAEMGSLTCLAGTPTVSITVDGTTTVFNDVGFVLNTGGYDQVNSSPCLNSKDTTGACNESLQWRDVSSTCGLTCPGGIGAPEFGLPVVAVAAMGLVALLLLRRVVILHRSASPVRAFQE